MPHEENAFSGVHALAAARCCHGVMTILTAAHPHELERAAGSWHAESFALPLVFHTAGAALEAITDTVSELVFDRARARWFSPRFVTEQPERVAELERIFCRTSASAAAVSPCWRRRATCRTSTRRTRFSVWLLIFFALSPPGPTTAVAIFDG
jgi:hypothetical protein